MCNCCYWCASYLTSNIGYISVCPVCGSHKMEWLPISHSESYRLDRDEVRGMVMDFWTKIEDGGGGIPQSTAAKVALL